MNSVAVVLLVSLTLTLGPASVAAQGPSLFMFGVDLTSGFVALIFDSPVMLSCDPTQVTLYSSSDVAATSFTFTGGMCQYQDPDMLNLLAMFLSQNDIQAISNLPNLCTIEDNCYITLTDTFVGGIDSQPNQAVDSPVQAFQVHQEEVLPLEIQNAVLDLDSGSLVIQANQEFTTVNVAMLNITKGSIGFTLQPISPVQYTQQGLPNASIPLDSADINLIKGVVESPPNITAWQIYFPSGSVQGNNDLTVNETQLTLIVAPDTTNPVLESFSLDMNIGLLTVTFNEIMKDAATTSLIFLASTPSVPSLNNYTLDGSNYTLADDQVSFDIVFSDTLFTDIQADEVIAKDESTTYLYLAPTSFFDLGGSAINETIGQQVLDLTLETEPPSLLSFTMMVDFGILRLTFSEPMKTSSLMLDQFTLLVSIDHQLSLSNDESIQFADSNSQLEITLTSTTLNSLKILFFESGSNFLAISITETAISDSSSNPIISIPPSNPLLASSLQLDSMHPSLLSFLVVSSPPLQYTLNFTFSEYMNLSSFDISALILILQSDDIGTNQYSLNGGIIETLGYTGLTYALSDNDLALPSLIEFFQIAYYTGNISIIYDTGLVTDLNGLIIVAPLTPTVYQSMETDLANPPSLSTFSLDLVTRMIQVNFSKPIVPLGSPNTLALANSISNSKFRLINSTSYINLPKVGQQSFLLTLDENDVNFLLADDEFATDITNTFLTIQPEFGIDLSGNKILQSGIIASEVIVPIVIEPSSSIVITSSSSSSSTLSLTSEMTTMIMSSFDSSLLMSSSVTSTNIVLSTSLILSSIDTTSMSSLLMTESSQLMTTSSEETQSMTTSTAQSVMTSSSETMQSMTTTTQLMTSSSETTQSMTTSSSETAQSMTSTTQLMTSSSETTQSMTTTTELMTSSSSLFETLTQSMTTTTQPMITSSETTQSMSSSSETSQSTSIPSPTSSVITTSTSSSVISTETPVPSSTSSSSTSVMTPSPSPTPVSLSNITINQTAFDLDTGLLMIEFSDQILLEQVGNNGEFYFTNTTTEYFLTSIELVFSLDSISTMMTARLNSIDLVNVKAHRINVNWSIGLTQGAVIDTDSSEITAQLATFTNFVPDTTAPRIISFDLDMNFGLMKLLFDEPIEENSVNVSDIYISSELVNSADGYSLSGGVIVFNGSNSLNVYLTVALLNSLKYDSDIATSLLNTNLYIQGGQLKDYYNNTVLEFGLSASVNDLNSDTTSPVLLSHSLNLDSGIISLTFDEPIISDSINTAGASIANGQDDTALIVPLSGGLMGTSNFDTEVNLFLSNLEDIKYILSENSNGSYLSIPTTLVVDVSFNSVANVTNILATHVIEDVTPPQVFSITPLANSPVDSTITFSFNEYISLFSMNELEIMITIGNNTFNGFSGGTWLANTNTSIVYKFSNKDLNQDSFGPEYIIAINAGQILVTFGNTFGTDLGGNSILIPEQPLSYSTTKTDTIPPTLTAFELDTDSGELTLSFSETVILGVVSQSLQLQNKMANPTIVYTLTSSDSVEIIYGKKIIIMMSSNDTSNLLNVTGFANAIEDTFLTPSSQLAIDYSGNSMSPGDTIQASSVLTPFTPEAPAILLQSQLDLNTGNIVLYFDKTVQAAATKTKGIMITNDITNIILQADSITSIGQNDTIIIVQLNSNDLNSIKYSASISQVPFNVSISNDSVFNEDMIGNEQQSIAVSVISDKTSPSVTMFSLDMNSGTLLITFSEPMNNVTYNASNVWLSGSVANDPTGYNLVNSQVMNSFNQSTILLVAIQTNTLNDIKADNTLGINKQNTYLFLSANSFYDIFDNPLMELTESLQATVFIEDSTLPLLESFALDLNNGVMSLTFNEPVDVSTFDPSNIKVFNSDQTNSLTINDFTLENSAGYNTIAALTITLDTLNNLKVLIDSSSQAFMSTTESTIEDVVGNLLNPISDSNPLLSTNIIQDSTSPSITSFTAGDENSKTITLTFNEFVQPLSWNGNSLTLTLDSAIGTNVYSVFSDGNVLSGVSNSITYVISDAKFQPLFSIHYQQSYYSGSIGITFTSNLIQDVSDNQIVPLTQPLYYNSNSNDPVTPQLLSFDLDLDTSTLVMTFSENIILNNLKDNVKLQNIASSPSQIFVLSSNSYSSQNGLYGSTITITMTTTDVKSLANNGVLATSVNDTFLVINAELGSDYSGNLVTANNVGLPASSYLPLTGPINPRINSFDLDLDSDQLTFHFDTPVDVSTFVSSRITLVNESSVGVNTYTIQLSNTTVIAQGIQTDFRILLSTSNIVDIKRNPLCYTIDNCYATFSEGVAISKDNLPSQAINSPLQVSILNQDVTPPRFLSFPVFDLNSGFFTIIFSEPVNGSSTDFTQIQFGSSMSNAIETVTLNDGFTSPDHVELDFHLTNDDLNQIKYHLNLCTQTSNCWLRLPSFILTDIGSNPFLHSNYHPTADASYHKPTVFVSDSTAPNLNEISVDMHLGKIVFVFDEVIDETLFTPLDVTLLNKQSGELSLVLSNTTEFTVAGNGTKLEIYFTKDDLNWLKSRDLFSSLDDSYISLTTSMTDISGNEFNDIGIENAYQGTEFIRDNQNAILVSFELFNIDNGSLILLFDEPVNSSSFIPTAVTIVNGDSSALYQLTGGLAMAITNEKTIIMIQLATVDRVAIKLMSGLADSFDNTFIALESYAFVDSFDNSNQEIALASAAQLNSGDRFVPDTSPSSLMSFNINMNTGVLTLTFDDVINAKSFESKFLTIQNNTDNTISTSYTLDDSVLASNSSNIILVNIGAIDGTSIKSQLELAKSVDNTYISFTASIAMDIEGRFLIATPNTNAMGVSEYIPDATSPRLLSYNLDVDEGEMIMTFNEPILLSSLTPTGLIFQNTKNNPTTTYIMQGGEVKAQSQGAAADIIITLKLSSIDLNEVKSRTTLATAITNSYIAVDPSLLVDTSNNNIELVSGMNTAEYVADITLPTLVESSLDMTDGGKLIMKFSEAIQYTGLLSTSVRIQNSFTSPNEVIFLQDPSNVVTKTDLHEITVTLSNANTNKINNDASIASSTANAFILITPGGIFDYSQGGVGQSLASTTTQITYIYRTCFIQNTYNNIEVGTCDVCSSVCVGGCTGAGSFAGDGGCSLCNVIQVDDSTNQVQCLSINSDCPDTHYSDTNTIFTGLTSNGHLCRPCHDNCATCSGAGAENCDSCQTALELNGAAIVQCLTSCPQDSTNCQYCHSECNGCTGPSNTDCIDCVGQSQINSDGQTVCVPSCSNDEYLADINGEFLCIPCHRECIGCSGPSNSECTLCKNYNNSIIAGFAECSPRCLFGTYADTSGTCIHCDPLCDGCTGPSSSNCTLCTEESLSITGETVCVPTCPLLQQYDIGEKACTLSQTGQTIVIAVCCSVGVVLILIVIIVAICCVSKCRKNYYEDKFDNDFDLTNKTTTSDTVAFVRSSRLFNKTSKL